VHVSTVECRGRISDHSHQPISPGRHSLHLKHTAIPMHDFQTFLHTDVPNVAGRAMDKMGYGGGNGAPSYMAGRLPDFALTDGATRLAYSSGGGCLLLTGMGTKHAVAAPGLWSVVLLNNLSPSCSTFAGPGTIILDAPLNAPIKDVVVLVSFTDEEVPEEFPQVGVIGFVVEPQCPSVVQEYGELIGEATAKKIGGGGHLLLHNPVVLLFLGSSLETLPREGAAEEVHEDVSERFEVIAASLFNTQMSVDGGVASGTSQVLVLSVGNVKVGLRVPVLLGKTEVDDIDLISALADSHQKVVGFDVTVNEVAGMNVLDARNQLISEQ